jgi:hypothetical protein
MKITFSNIKTLAVVALPMFIAVLTVSNVQAQAVPGASKGARCRVAGSVITVVNKSGESLQSNNGGQSWQILDAQTTQNVTSNLQQVIAKRQLAAQATATGAMVSPNPTNGVTTVNFEMIQSGAVVLTVFNAQGIQVLKHAQGIRQAGANSATFDAAGFSNGVYYYRITVDGANATGGKVVVAQ